MIDGVFLLIVNKLREFPSILVSFLSYIFCIISIVCINKYFKYVGLCCYTILCGILANIQFLYPTSYEIFNLKVCLGTVVFSSTFMVCDLINSQYGKNKAINSTYMNLFFNIFFLINMLLTIGHKPLDNNQLVELNPKNNIDAMQTIFLQSPRIILSSYISYFIAQFTEIWLFLVLGSGILRHNIALFISSSIVDNFTFTLLSMYILNEHSISLYDILQISSSAIIVRLFCNLFNTIIYRFIKPSII